MMRVIRLKATVPGGAVVVIHLHDGIVLVYGYYSPETGFDTYDLEMLEFSENPELEEIYDLESECWNPEALAALVGNANWKGAAL